MLLFVLVLYLAVLGIRAWLFSLNLSHLKAHGHVVPPEFAGVIDPDRLVRISAYTAENNRASMVEATAGSLVTLVFFFGGLLGVCDRFIASVTGSFLLGGVLFFLLLLYAETLLGMPFSLYRNFRIEGRYGFNTMTARLWTSDFLKAIALSTVLGVAVVAAALAIVRSSPLWWWLWVWAFLLGFGIFLMYLSPYVIEPLFFKFEPVKAPGLEEKIRELMERAGLTVSRVFQVDASRRSKHSNAYFTGIGRVKRIVLFDTLIEQMSQEEILAVLAHEVGHWKKRHVLKGIVFSESLAFCALLAAHQLLSWEGLPGLVGLTAASFYAKALIVGFLGSLVLFPLTPLFSFLSRRNEEEADRFAAALTGRPETLASALVKLSSENLSNLHPHRLYAKFYYSHPPVVERIRKLKQETGDRRQETEDRRQKTGVKRSGRQESEDRRQKTGVRSQE